MLDRGLRTLVEGRLGDELVFPPEPHAELMQDCDRCHLDIDAHDVTSGTRRALEETCLECHRDRADDCAMCHTDVAAARSAAAADAAPEGIDAPPERDRQLRFSHRNHGRRTRRDCSVCHPGAHGVEPAAETSEPAPSMPGHDQCFSCHQMQSFYDRLECSNCHEALQRYGLEPFDRFSHTADFVAKSHGDHARTVEGMATCDQCHQREFCAECHRNRPLLRLWERMPDRPFRTFVHPGDYISRHAFDVRADSASCQRCHKPDECRSCHDSRGRSQEGSLATGFQFHGPGVLFPGSPDFHGDAARRDIMSCAACHQDGSRASCIDCHAVGEFGGNPHPRGFRSQLSRTGAAVCRLCHVR
jgi:hypothetical protein